MRTGLTLVFRIDQMKHNQYTNNTYIKTFEMRWPSGIPATNPGE